MPNCTGKDCDRSFDNNHMPESSAVQLGWGCHNSEWLCPEHQAEQDAPAIKIAEEKALAAEAKRIAEENRAAVLAEARRLDAPVYPLPEEEADGPRTADTQDLVADPAPADHDSEG